jgi:hypothetical protein
MIVGAVGHHQSNEAVARANRRTTESEQKLTAIQNGISDLKKALPLEADLSNQGVLTAAIARLQQQEQEIAQLKRASRLNNHVCL